MQEKSKKKLPFKFWHTVVSEGLIEKIKYVGYLQGTLA
jgi:hypothetical protein